MLRHYFLTAQRSLLRHKAFTAINLLGLSLGLASALMLFVFIYNQALKDNHIPDLERYVRVESFTGSRANEGFYARVHPGVGPALKDNLPQVEEFVRMNAWNMDIYQSEGGLSDTFVNARFLITDSSFFSLFPQKFTVGNERNPFQDKKSIVITESIAKRFFGDENPVGQTLNSTFTRLGTLTITAVIKDPGPDNSIQFDVITVNRDNYGLDSGGYSPISTYLKLSPNTPLDELAQAANATIAPMATGALKSLSYRMTAFDQVKYDLNNTDDVVIPANQELILIFTLIAVFILVLAVINYINLSTSKALQRAKEAGIRKIIGAGKSSFFYQFVTESVLLSLLAFPLAMFFFTAAQPYFEAALNMNMAVSITNLKVFSASLLLVLITGLVAGSYPAFIISRFRFYEFIKGNFFDSQKGAGFRRALVVFQFAIAMLLVICAVLVQQQLQYVQQQKLTYSPEQIVVLDRGLSTKFDLLKNELDQMPGVIQSSLTSSPPGGDDHRMRNNVLKLGDLLFVHEIDADYADLLNLEFISGDNYDPAKESENERSVIINETLAKMLITTNPKQLDKPLEGKYPFNMVEQSIKAIVKDFHMQSMHQKIKPMAFVYEPFKGYTGAHVMLKLNTQNISETLTAVEAAWYKYLPKRAFRYTFLDQRFASLYTTETRLSRIFNVFTGIAIVISCLGLYGLIAFMAASKSKEVGIRKVLGASVLQITRLFTQKVFGLILLSSVFAIPLAWWAMSAWLQGFAYHIQISFTVFVACIAGVFLIGSAAVLFRIVRSANANPVEVLRTE